LRASLNVHRLISEAYHHTPDGGTYDSKAEGPEAAGEGEDLHEPRSGDGAHVEEEEVECFAVSRVYDASEVVVITKDLPVEGDEWDPMLRVDLEPHRSELHPGDSNPSPGDIENIRASGLRRLLAALVSAVARAEAAGVIPPELDDTQWQERFEQGLRTVTRKEG
jgi:hypothetical protein